MTTGFLIVTILVAAVCTFATRAVPFVLFGGKKEPPKIILYLGKILPVAILGILIVYGIGDFTVLDWNDLAPKLIGVALTAAVHLWKRNVLLSISVGTIGYMLLINFVF